MDRVHSRSQRHSPCKEPGVRDNTVLQPADNGGVNCVANANEHGPFQTTTKINHV